MEDQYYAQHNGLYNALRKSSFVHSADLCRVGLGLVMLGVGVGLGR